MKRFIRVALSDIRFQYAYGFYFLYLFVSLLYTAIIVLLPQSWRHSARILAVFSDPAALGLFFMGAIILYEKGGNVLQSLAVSPVRTGEYVLSKMISIGIVSVFSGAAVCAASGGKLHPFFFTGLFLGSCFFTLLGICFGTRITTINQFLIFTVPAEILIFVPAILYYFGYIPQFLTFHPGVLVLRLLDAHSPIAFLDTLLLGIQVGLLFIFTCRFSRTLFREEGKEAGE